MRAWAFLLVAACFASAAPARAEGPADQGYRKLGGREIRAFFTGKIFVDGTHFSSRYEADGKIDGFAMGKKVSNTWKILDGNLCIADSLGELCYAVWKKGSNVELVEKNSDITIYGSVTGGGKARSSTRTSRSHASVSDDGKALITGALVLTARQARRALRAALYNHPFKTS